MYDYFPTKLDILIITEFSDWLWEHIFAIFSKKKSKEWRFGILRDSSFRNHCVHFMEASPKQVEIIQILALENFSVEVFHSFWQRCHDQRRRGIVF